MIHVEMSQEEFDNLTKDAARYRFLRKAESDLTLIRWEDDEGSPIAGNWMDFTIDQRMNADNGVE